MGRIIPFNNKITEPVITKKEQESRKKSRSLTALMIKTLRLAFEKQKQHLPFGPADIDGSATALIARGLLKTRKVQKDGKWS